MPIAPLQKKKNYQIHVKNLSQWFLISVPVIGSSNCVETFLTGCVPNLQFDFLSSQFNCLDFEVNANGRNKSGVKGVITESEQNTGLANSGVTNQQKLE